MPTAAQMLIAVQWATVLMGAACVALSIYLAWHLWRTGRELGTALGAMLAAEAIMGGATLVFAVSPVMGFDAAIGPWGDIVLRWIVFIAAGTTSVHLAWRIHVIQRGGDGAGHR